MPTLFSAKVIGQKRILPVTDARAASKQTIIYLLTFKLLRLFITLTHACLNKARQERRVRRWVIAQAKRQAHIYWLFEIASNINMLNWLLPISVALVIRAFGQMHITLAQHMCLNGPSMARHFRWAQPIIGVHLNRMVILKKILFFLY